MPASNKPQAISACDSVGTARLTASTLADQTAPIGLSIGRCTWLAIVVAARLIDVADGDELRAAFVSKSGVDARVLSAKMSDANDCGSKCHD